MVYPLVPGSLVALDIHQSKGMKKYEILTEILRMDTLETDPVTHRSVMKYNEPKRRLSERCKIFDSKQIP